MDDRTQPGARWINRSPPSSLFILFPQHPSPPQPSLSYRSLHLFLLLPQSSPPLLVLLTIAFFFSSLHLAHSVQSIHPAPPSGLIFHPAPPSSLIITALLLQSSPSIPAPLCSHYPSCFSIVHFIISLLLSFFIPQFSPAPPSVLSTLMLHPHSFLSPLH